MSACHLKVAILARVLSGSMLLTSTALLAQIAQHAVTVGRGDTSQIITLDHGGAPQSPNYQLAPGEYSFANGPANFYAFSPAKAGAPAPLESVTLRFAEPTTITKIESTNHDFVVEDGGSCAAGRSYEKGDSCIVLLRFTPQGPGRRLGQLNVSHTGSAQPASVGLGGNGYAPSINFVPSRTYTIAATYSAPNGVLKSAVSMTDAGDILYIPDPGNTQIREFDGSGTMTNLTPDFTTPISVAVDNFGFVWALSAAGSTYYLSDYYPWGQSAFGTAYKSGGTCTDSTPCAFSTYGMDDPGDINIDHSNNLFMEERSKGALEMPVGEVSGGTGALNEWYLSDEYAYDSGSAAAFAIDGYDDLYTFYAYGPACYIVQEPLYGAENGDPVFTRVAGASKCGFAGDGGQATAAEISTSIGQIAFDAAGDLYFADAGNQRVRMINVNTGIITTVVGTGVNGFTVGVGNRSTALPLSNPTGVAVDSQGQIYVVTDAPSGAATQVVQQVGMIGFLNFSNQTQGTTSPAQIVTVINTGNSSMALTNYVINGTNSGDFSVDPNTTDCVLTAGATLNSGQTCKIGLLFKPAGTGSRNANLVLNDNTVTGANTVNLSGTGTAPAPAFVPGSVEFPATTPTQSNTMPVTITNKGNVDLQMTNVTLAGTNADMFSFASNCMGGSVAPGASCTLNITFKPSSTGNYAAKLTFTDNAPNSPQAVFVSGTGQKPYTSATKLTSAANPAPACSAITFKVAVSTSDGSAASGPVSLQAGTLTLASGTLTNGAATLTVNGLAPGLNLVTANYAGDTEHAGSTTTLSQMVNRGSCGSFHPPLPADTPPVRESPITDRP